MDHGAQIITLNNILLLSQGLIPERSSRLFIQALRLLSLGVRWPEHEADHSLPSSAKVYFNFLTYLQGMVLD
jgi:hypothetical protein